MFCIANDATYTYTYTYTNTYTITNTYTYNRVRFFEGKTLSNSHLFVKK